MKYSENCVYAAMTPVGVKIGFSSRLGDRLNALQKKHGVACYPIVLMVGLTKKAAMAHEASLHDRLNSHEVSREYFDITTDEAHKAFDFERRLSDALV